MLSGVSSGMTRGVLDRCGLLGVVQQIFDGFAPQHLVAKDRPKCRATVFPACSRVGTVCVAVSISFSRLVTPRSVMPQGTISSKSRRSVVTFSAKPCEVIPREMCTPMAAIFFSGIEPPGSVHTPVRFGIRWVTMP